MFHWNRSYEKLQIANVFFIILFWLIKCLRAAEKISLQYILGLGYVTNIDTNSDSFINLSVQRYEKIVMSYIYSSIMPFYCRADDDMTLRIVLREFTEQEKINLDEEDECGDTDINHLVWVSFRQPIPTIANRDDSLFLLS